MKNENKIYIISTIFAVLALLLLALSVFLFNEIAKKSEDLSSGINKAAVLEKEFNDIENFKNQYADYQPNLEKIDQLFISSNNPVDFIKFLERTAFDYELALDVSVPSFSKGLAISGNFQFSLAGSFPKIVQFIQTIENGPYLIRVQSLNISKTQSSAVAKGQPASKGPAVDQAKANVLIQVLAE